MTELNSFDPILIRASAGSGKTFQLTSRFLRLLLAGESPDRILATTFTRKAAGEIAGRVFTRLAQAAVDDGAAARLGGELGFPRLTARETGAALRRLALQEHRLNICTLDSFFHGIAAAFGLEIGLQPGWTVADTFTLERLFGAAVKNVCADTPEDELTRQLQLLRGGRTARRVMSDLKTLLSSLLDVYRATQRAHWVWLDDEIPSAPGETGEIIEAVRGIPIPVTGKGTPRKSWSKALEKLAAALEGGEWREVLELGIVQSVLKGINKFDTVEISPDIVAIIEEVTARAVHHLVTVLADQNRASYTLLEALDHELDELKRASKVLYFSDVKHKLRNAAAVGSLDEVYYRLDSRIAHLLLDEFQDTSRAEWEILAPMADEIMSKASGEHSFLCVGDTKQAIYGWRGGVAEIFNRLRTRWGIIDEVPLAKTRRCSPAVVDTVNAVFGPIALNSALSDYSDAAAAWGSRFDHHATVETERCGYAVIEAVPGDDAEAIRLSIEGRVVSTVRELVAQSCDITIGVLTRRNAAVGAIMYALQRAGIPASDESKSTPLDSPAVQIIVALLRLADHPGDTIARFHVATSPLGAALGYTNFSDSAGAEELGQMLRERVQADGFGPTIAAYSEHLVPFSGDRDRRRIAQCIEQAHLYKPDEPTRLAEFTRRLALAGIEGGHGERVRVMTIHQSKGLEFDAVVLIDIDSPLVRRGDSLQFPVITYAADPTEPPLRVSRRPTAALARFVPELREMIAQSEAEQVKDGLSVLYVAMTRARYALYTFVGTRGERGTLGAVLRAAFGGVDGVGTLYATGTAEWALRFRAEKKKVLPRRARLTEPIVLPPAPTRRRRGLLRETPSGREGGSEVAARDILRLRGSETAEYGRIIHRLFQEVEWYDTCPDDTALTAVIARELVGSDTPAGLIADFRDRIRAPRVRESLERTRYAAWRVDALEVLREQSFAVREGDAVITGTFDRVVIGSRGGIPVAAHVIDYKTDRVTTAEEVALRAHYYAPQITAYIGAAARFARLPVDAVGASILFVTPGIVHTYTPGSEAR